MLWFKRLSFGKKILSSYIIFIGISFLLSGIYCLRSIETSKEENGRYMHQFAEQVNLNLDVIFSNMDRIRFLHLIDDKVKPMIRTPEQDKSLAKELEDEDYVTRALNHMTNMNQYILRATYVNEYGDIYSNVKTENASYLEKMQMIQQTQNWDDRHKIFYTGVYRETIHMVDYPLVTSISKIYDIDQNGPIGTLFVDLNFSAVKQILDQTLEPQSTGTHLMIFDQNGEVIYHTNGGEDLWSRISEEEKEQLTGLVLSDDRENNGRETEEVRIEGKGAAASVTKNKSTGWRVLVYTPYSNIYAAGIQNILGVAITMAVVLVLAMILGVLLSRQISRPVRILIKAMEKVDRGNVKYIDEKEFDWQDEMGYLLRSYNQMGQRINDSIEKIYIYQLNQKQTELKMLQFQINPHFLYNTLNTISAIASLEGIDEIARISDNLSSMFQYNIKGSDIVPMKLELRQVNSYMTIQTIRFPGKYMFTQTIEPGLEEEPMLKFLIQPLVENSLKHAFQKLREINRIDLKASRDKENIRIEITDNGVGMKEQTVRMLNEELADTDTQTLVSNVDRGIGLRNVNARIKNFYGKEYGIQIESREGSYTVIHILIRTIRKEEQEGQDAQNRSS